jgi:hypothetical protein
VVAYLRPEGTGPRVVRLVIGERFLEHIEKRMYVQMRIYIRK